MKKFCVLFCGQDSLSGCAGCLSLSLYSSDLCFECCGCVCLKVDVLTRLPFVLAGACFREEVAFSVFDDSSCTVVLYCFSALCCWSVP